MSKFQITHFHYKNQKYYVDKIIEFKGKFDNCKEYKQYKDSVRTLLNSNGTPIYFVYKELDNVYDYESVNDDDMKIPKQI